MTKQIVIGILATISLGLFGIGSYFASRQLFPDPKQATTATPTPSGSASSVPTVRDYTRLTPQNINAKLEGTDVVLSFETAEKVEAFVYITSQKSEKILQIMKDKNNGVPVAGKFYTSATKAEPKSTHTVSFPRNSVTGSGDSYYFIVVGYKDSWLTYGAVSDAQNGATEPYTLKL